MHNTIVSSLRNIQQDHDVVIPFACESGSRAWDFASPDSDWDVRFIYVPNISYYFRLDERRPDDDPRDVIEIPITGDLDINGWELRKALGLIFRSNPTVFEWLNSPIIYQQSSQWVTYLRKLAMEFYSPMKAHHHYLSMANKNLREHLKGDMVRYKKYLYVIRPLLAVQWIAAGKGIPPMKFTELMDGVVTDIKLRREIKELLVIKMRGGEADLQPTRPVLNTFIQEMLDMYSKVPPDFTLESQPDITKLDRFLKDTVLYGI